MSKCCWWPFSTLTLGFGSRCIKKCNAENTNRCQMHVNKMPLKNNFTYMPKHSHFVRALIVDISVSFNDHWPWISDNGLESVYHHNIFYKFRQCNSIIDCEKSFWNQCTVGKNVKNIWIINTSQQNFFFAQNDNRMLCLCS